MAAFPFAVPLAAKSPPIVTQVGRIATGIVTTGTSCVSVRPDARDRHYAQGQVVLYRIEGGVHRVPGATQDIRGGEVLWTFFRDKSRS
jgi:poly(3-hydroxybutyrate) depolymerase